MPPSNFIYVTYGDVFDHQRGIIDNVEAYQIIVGPAANIITVKGRTKQGAFNGAKTLISLIEQSEKIAEIDIADFPRYEYRGK